MLSLAAVSATLSAPWSWFQWQARSRARLARLWLWQACATLAAGLAALGGFGAMESALGPETGLGGTVLLVLAWICLALSLTINTAAALALAAWRDSRGT